jgi:FkbM family methyltransferase
MILNFIGFILVKKNISFSSLAGIKGTKQKFFFNDTNSQFQSIYAEKYRYNYEPEVFWTIKTFLKKNSVFIDVGANWGHHSFFAAINSKAKVIAFEPNPIVCKNFREINEQLSTHDKVSIFDCALGNKITKNKLVQSYFSSGLCFIEGTEFEPETANDKEFLLKRLLGLESIKYDIEVKTLDSFDLKKIDLIKIDTEGFELEVLKGGETCIKKHKPIIIFEANFYNPEIKKQIYLFFKKNKYALYQIKLSEAKKFFYTASLIPLTSITDNVKKYNLVALPKKGKIQFPTQAYAKRKF